MCRGWNDGRVESMEKPESERCKGWQTTEGFLFIIENLVFIE